MLKKICALLLALALPLGLTACGDDDAAVGRNAIRIGHIVDRSGTESMTGDEAVRSMDFALRQLGGQIAGRPVEIVTVDAQGDVDSAAEAVRRLVDEENVVAVLGPTQIEHKVAAAEYTSGVGIPLIFYNATPAAIVGSYDNVFSAGGGTAQFPSVMADYLYNELGYRTIVTLTQDSAGGHTYIDPLIIDFTALGGTVAEERYAPIGTGDFSSYLADLPEADALISWVSGDDAVALWSAWYDTGLYKTLPMHAAMHGGFTDSFICDALAKERPEVLEAMLKETYAPIAYTYTIDSEENHAFVDAWTEQYGEVPLGNNLPGATYSALQLLAAAIESLDGDTDPAKLCAAIQSTEITGPEGRLYFADNHTAVKDIHVVKLVQLEDGSYNYEIVKTYPAVPGFGLVVG